MRMSLSNENSIAHSLRLPSGDVPLFGQGKRREVYEDREDLPTRPAFFLALPAVESGSNGSGPGLEYLLRPAQAGTSATGPVARTARDATSNQGALRLAQPIGSGDLPRLPRHDRDDPPASPCPSRDA